MGEPYPIKRKHQRIDIKIPIIVDGVDANGRSFIEPTETVNGSSEGLGLLLGRQPKPSSHLDVYIVQGRRLYQFRSEIRHITMEQGTTTVGVKFLGVPRTF